MDEDQEEEILRIRRKRISRIQLTSIIVEDDEQLVKKIQQTIAEEEEERRSFELLIPHLKSMRESKGDAAMEKRAKWIKEREEKKRARAVIEAKTTKLLPPLYSNDFEEIDVSNIASFVVVDALQLPSRQFSVLLEFSIKCRYKCCYQLFDHPGYPRILHRDKKPEDECEIVTTAIHQYNDISQNTKLKLEKIVRINILSPCLCCAHSEYYMTFFAMDEKTKEVRLYQAAAIEYDKIDDNYMLGLLRDCFDNYRILAVLSLTGVEEEYLAIKKKELDDRYRCVAKSGQ